MTYKETLHFVSKCLTLGICPERKTEIVEQIRGGKVVWEHVVAVSSGQFVLPALFVRFQRAGILQELPTDLVEYMEYLIESNRQRNLQILAQMKEISSLLNRHGIQPIFLKGTAHLLSSLYDDIAERMIGDIDFLVEEKDFLSAAQLLIDTGYQPLIKFNKNAQSITKHYPRLQNFNYPAAVEVHRVVIAPPKDDYLKSTSIINEKQRIEGEGDVFIPSTNHLIIHNILNTQINDKAYLWGDIHLRQMYDMLLLSNRIDLGVLLKEYPRLIDLSNAYLAAIDLLFDTPFTKNYENNWQVRFYMKRLKLFIRFPKYLPRIYKSTLYMCMRFSRYLTLPIQSIFNNEVRSSLWFRISDPKWYRSHVLSYVHYFYPNQTH